MTAEPSPPQRRRELLAQITKIGLVLPGSLNTVMNRCGKPRCACHGDPPRLHGPYITWTRKVAGKTTDAPADPRAGRALPPLVRQQPPPARAHRRTRSTLTQTAQRRRGVGGEIAIEKCGKGVMTLPQAVLLLQPLLRCLRDGHCRTCHQPVDLHQLVLFPDESDKVLLDERMELVSTRLSVSLSRALDRHTRALRDCHDLASQKALPMQEVLAAVVWALGDPDDEAAVDRLDAIYRGYRARRIGGEGPRARVARGSSVRALGGGASTARQRVVGAGGLVCVPAGGRADRAVRMAVVYPARVVGVLQPRMPAPARRRSSGAVRRSGCSACLFGSTWQSRLRAAIASAITAGSASSEVSSTRPRR